MKYSQQVLRGNDLYLSNLERSAKLISKKAEAFKMVLIDRQMPIHDARTSNDIENDKIGRVKEFNFVSSIIFKRNFGQIGQLEKILNDNNLMLYFLKHSPKVIKEARTILQPNFQDVYQITKKLYNADNNALNTLYLREQTKNYRDYIIYLMKQIIELLKLNRGQSINNESVDSKIIEMEDFINRLQYSENPDSFIQTNTGMNVNEFMSELIEQMSDYDNDEETNDLVNQMSELLGDDDETEEKLNEDNEQYTIFEPEQNTLIQPEEYGWEETKNNVPTYTQDNPPPIVNEPAQPPIVNQPPPPPPRVNQQPPPPPPRVNQPPPPRVEIVEEDENLREQLKKDREDMINTRNQKQPQQQDILSQIANKRQEMNRQDNKSIEEILEENKLKNQKSKPLDIMQQVMNRRQEIVGDNTIDTLVNKIEENKQQNEEEKGKKIITFAQMLKDGKEKIKSKSEALPSYEERIQEIENNKKPKEMSALEKRMVQIRNNTKDESDESDDDDNGDEWMGAGGFGRKKINSLTYQELRSILSVLGLPNSRGLKKPQLLKILKGYKNKNKK